MKKNYYPRIVPIYNIPEKSKCYRWYQIRPRASERGSGANLSESAESLRGVRVGTLGESHIGHVRGERDLGLVVKSHDKNVMCLRGGRM